jgi:Ca2+-binding RTX toxin-like protein
MSRRKKPRTRLQIETLETRALMTVSYLNGTVILDGTNARDVFKCYQTTVSGKTELKVEEGTGPLKVTTTYDLSVQPVNLISADLKGANDRLICDATVQIPVWASGGTGVDVISGGSKEDNLSGGDQLDVLAGGLGDDTLSGGDQNDVITGGDGRDLIDGGDDNDILNGGIGNDTIQCGDGIDVARGSDGDDAINGSGGTDFLFGDQGFDNIDGGDDHGDLIRGGTENDTLNGGVGEDTILGDSGDDSILGGDGFDSLNGGAGNDTLDGGTNRDTVVGGDGPDIVRGGDGQDRLFGDGSGATAPGDDTLSGGDGNDRVNGDGGNDTANGDAGDDNVLGGTGRDTLRGGDGNDTIRGGDGADRIYGGADDDNMFGENQDDELFGDEGTDTLDGGPGNDTLVSIDADTADVLFGRGGRFDSFWVDDDGTNVDDIRNPSTDETETNLHFVQQFENADKTLNGDVIAEPAGGDSSEDFAGLSLFGTDGPSVTDIQQGDLADCWLMASLAGAVHISPNVARQLIVDLGDGTYAVHTRNALLNTDEFFRVDTDLPVKSSDLTKPQFAGLGADGDSLWVPLVEKAWAIDKSNDYMQLESSFDPFSETGSSFFPLGQIGGTSRRIFRITDGDRALGNLAANNWAGTYWTKLDQAEALHTSASHCYAIMSVDFDGAGNPTFVHLYNPHGEDRTPIFDENGNFVEKTSIDGDDDGFVTLTIDEFVHDAQDPIGVITADFNDFN